MQRVKQIWISAKLLIKVPHRLLLLKLSHYGVRGDILSWISSFLTGRTQSVVCGGGHTSTPCDVLSGVP